MSLFHIRTRAISLGSFILFILAGLFISGCQKEKDVPAENRYSKVDGSGNIKPADADKWSCTLDNKTELLWEVKGQFGKRFFNARYTNTTGLDPSTITARGKCVWDNTTFVYVEDSSCHTQGYVNYINELGLCGYTDWRVPTKAELETILFENLPPPHWSTHYFPRSAEMFNSWSGSFPANILNEAFKVRTLFERPIQWTVQGRATPLAVRLVRGQLAN